MKAYLLLLLLLPLISAQQFTIECHGYDDYMVNMKLKCQSSDVQQACYTRDNGEKGCIAVDKCSRPGWTCCHSNLCNE
ncbi:uncharacterized protein [Nerophis lumbriciformis]|uniref:uncharacterized protein n=1 Tax=Nerophis lumbriciformis TaxID=546530 RepID=UPI002ADFDB3D|nr:uncharacterized protein wu:fj16a03 [Nerophis lumbriciformis]